MIVVMDARMRVGPELAEGYDFCVAVAADINTISICAAAKNRFETKSNILFTGTSLCNTPKTKSSGNTNVLPGIVYLVLCQYVLSFNGRHTASSYNRCCSS